MAASIEEAENGNLQIRVLKYVAKEAQTAHKDQQAMREKPETQYEAAAILPPTRFTRPQSAPVSRRPISASVTSKTMVKTSLKSVIDEGEDESI